MKIHHATIDGASGAELLTMLLGRRPGRRARTDRGRRPERWPIRCRAISSQMEMVDGRCVNLARRPARVIRLQIDLLRRLGEITRNKGLVAHGPQRPALAPATTRRHPAPSTATVRRGCRRHARRRTPFNKTITPHRRLAFRSVPLDDIKALKNALDVTVNDVVMAVCAGALRRYLEGQDGAADRPADGDDPGVDPHRRRARQVDEPGVGPGGGAADHRGRPGRVGSRPCTRRWRRPRSSSTWSRPTSSWS